MPIRDAVTRYGAEGVSLYVLTVYADTQRCAVSAHPERLAMLVAAGEAIGLHLPDDVPYRARLQPIRAAELPDEQLFALLALPRDQFFDARALHARGVALVMTEPDRG